LRIIILARGCEFAMKVIIVGGGIGGLTTALMLHARGIDCEIYEQSDAIRELGVGINTLPHAIKELAELGLLDRLDAAGIRTYELFYTNRFGQEIWRELRGTDAGYEVPQFSIHRGRLQAVIYQAVRARLGESRIHTNHRLGHFREDEAGVSAYFFDRHGSHRSSARGDALVGADGIHSTVREMLYPHEGPARWNGAMLWRGAIDWPTFLTGRSMVIAGGMAAKLVVYPIAEGTRPDRRLTNWAVVARIGDGSTPPPNKEDWSRKGRFDELMPHVQRFRIPYVNAQALIEATPEFWEYPMCDRDPLVARPRHLARRRRASHVPGRLERRLPGYPRCPLPRRLPAQRRARRPCALDVRAGTAADDRPDRAHESQRRT
jgi:2-polyprenyl-6-methoxyphenol hydroxylase-like FAD-dependent oxidoreductase